MDLLQGQMEFFLQDSPVLLANMTQAITDGDAYQLQLAAHRLKGMLSRYAFTRAADVALELENKGRAATLDGASELVDQLRPMVSQLASAMSEYVK